MNLQALIEFAIGGVSYEQVFMIAPNLVPYAILGINFLHENNFEMNLAKGSFRTRRNGSDYERKFSCGSLPKGEMGVGLVASPGVQLNLTELLITRRDDERVNTVRAETTKNITSMCEESQRAVLRYHDKIKLKGLSTDIRMVILLYWMM
jgi:hypothetical protein